MPIPDADKVALDAAAVAAEGLDGWRYVKGRLVVRYATSGFSRGAALVTRIAEAADAADHHPDCDLRWPHLTISLNSHDVGAVTARDVRLAREISDLATEAGVEATTPPDVWEWALDTADHTRLTPFYAALLGFAIPTEGADEVVDRAARLPTLWFQGSDSTDPTRQRWHLDVGVAADHAAARVAAVEAAGGTVVDRNPTFWVVEDADGNRSCICANPMPAPSSD